jgi:hypothetical protein
MQLAAVRLPAFIIALQLAFLILFAIFVRYPELGLPVTNSEGKNATHHDGNDGVENGGHHVVAPLSHSEHGDTSKTEVAQYYPCRYLVY